MKCKINDYCCVYHACMGEDACQKEVVLEQGHPGWGPGRCEKRTKKIWTDQEDDFMQDCYPYNYTIDIAKSLNRTVSSVFAKAHLMGLKKDIFFYNRKSLDKNSSIVHHYNSSYYNEMKVKIIVTQDKNAISVKSYF